MNARFIILISGKIMSGKDSVADIVTTHLKRQGLKVANLKFAAGIKRAVASIYNIPVKHAENREFKNSTVPNMKDKTFRELYIEVGQALRNSVATDYWATVLLHEIKQSDADCIVVSDWRFKNEKTAILNSIFPKGDNSTTQDLANNRCCFFRVEAGPKREDIVQKELVLNNFLRACKESKVEPELDCRENPTTVKGEILMLDSLFKVAAIQQDISETDLDNQKDSYFDLVIKNEQGEFETTKSTVITYLNKVQW